MTTPPDPRPGPAEPDTDTLRVSFADLLADSVDAVGTGPAGGGVTDRQVAALDAAHDLLARALTALDTLR